LLQGLPNLLDRVQEPLLPADFICGLAFTLQIGVHDLVDPARPGRQQDDPIGDINRLLDRMGHEDDALVLLRQEIKQLLLKQPAGLLVDRREGLVHEQHVGVHAKRSGQSDPLAHAARQLVGVAPLETGQADLFDIAARGVLALLPGNTLQLQAEGHVAQHGGPGHQREVLEHEGALGARAMDRPSLDQDLTLGRLQQTRDDLEQGRLAAAAGAEQGGHLTFRKTQIDGFQRLNPAIVDLRNAPYLDDIAVGVGCHETVCGHGRGQV
jgi:hypothetical protein